MDVGDSFKLEHFRQEQLGLRGSEDGLDQIPGFGDDLFTAHRVLGSSADRVYVLAKYGSVGEEDIDGGLAGWETLLEFFISDQTDLLAFAEDGGIFHQSSVVSGAEGEGPLDDHYRDQMLQTDVGDAAVVDNGGFPRGDSHGDVADLRRSATRPLP